MKYERHYENSVSIPASPEAVFAYLDDHNRLSSHMNKPSWMMGGGSMQTSFDEGRGQKVGSHIQIAGKAFGIALFLDEVVTRREPPHRKTWETVGTIKLLVVGHYRMAFEIMPQDKNSILKVMIEYDHPQESAWFGRIFGGTYARWCVEQMLKDARRYFVESYKNNKTNSSF